MSRRFWLGTPKGQNTTADTFFNTLRETIYLVPTSAPTTFVDTTFLTPIELQPTGYYSNRPIYITSQSTAKTTYFLTPYITYYDTSFPTTYEYFVPTTYLTPHVTTNPTSAPTDYVVGTAYTTSFGTTYSQNTNTSFVTSYTYPVPTEYITPYPLFTTTFYGTSRPTTVTEYIYSPTSFPVPTTYPGYTTPTGYSTSSPTSYSQNFSGCFYYDSNGNIIAQDSAPAGCVNNAPCAYVENFTSGSVYTYFNTSSVTSGTTTFLTHVFVGQSTSSQFLSPGLTDPVHGIYGCYDAYDPDVFAYCNNAGTCEACDLYNNTTFTTDVGYDTYTSGAASVYTYFQTSALTAASYLSSRCYPNCAHTCTTTTSFQTMVATFYPPSTVSTTYSVNTYRGSTTYTIVTNFTTSNETFTGGYQPLNTLYVTQYPTSNVTSRSTLTSYVVNTTNPYNVPTTYLTSTSFITSFPTDYLTVVLTDAYANTSFVTTRETSNSTDYLTTNLTDSETLWFEVETTVSTSRMTDILTTYPQNTEVLTSRSTTWFTQ